MTGCECSDPGWCDRHKCKKSDRMHQLCQTRENYWTAWENGIGPGQKSRGLGDTVAKAINVATAGLVQPCGSCNKRKERLNALLPYRTQQKYEPITKRNLIYHVHPEEGYKDLVREVSKHRRTFSGKIVVAVGADPDHDVDSILDFLGEELNPHEIMVLNNNPEVRETATFQRLLESILSDDSGTATFYCHTKGNSTADSKDGARRWRQVMIQRLLLHWSDAMEHLRRYTFVGTHKMIWPENALPPYPTRLRAKHQWMHSGTFWWFRNDRVSEAYTPESIVWDRYGVEAWPSQLVHHEEAYSMWQPWGETEDAYPQRSPYDARLYDQDFSK
jgi:hypothetical protein